MSCLSFRFSKDLLNYQLFPHWVDCKNLFTGMFFRHSRNLSDFQWFLNRGKRVLSGFTLAEVLITLGIIGIVAALTIPTLLANYQKKQIVVQLKKAYSDMSQAVKMSELEHGEADGWDYNLNAQTFYEKYIQKYLNKTSEVKYGELRKINNYKNLNGTNCGESWCASNDSHYIMLADGALIGFRTMQAGIIRPLQLT